MGFVYLAHHVDAPNEHVAIKRLHALADVADRERLRRESVTMARLDHANILRVIDIVDDDGDIALVLPFAVGGSLAGRLAKLGPLPPHEVAATISAIADALEDAHAHGILHRDVKPSNILFDADDRPLLSDFGIARNGAQTNLTRTDLALGTAAYLAPEVADGAGPSSAADIYGLGVVAYEALTGNPPFRSSTPLGVLRAADHGAYTPLDRHRFGTLAGVVERAFDRRPERRWESAAAFAAALRCDVEAEPQPPAPVAESDALIDGTTSFRRKTRASDLVDAPPVTRSHRRLVMLSALTIAVVAAVAGLALRTGQPHRLRALPVPNLPICAAQTNAQCVQSYARTSAGVKVDFATGDRAEYRFGRTTDAIRVANFFCGERATPAIYRPEDGMVFYLSNWPDPTSDEPSEVSVDATGILGGAVSVGDTDRDGCADLAIDVGSTRTWFLPSVQTGRLQRGELAVSNRSAT